MTAVEMGVGRWELGGIILEVKKYLTLSYNWVDIESEI
jgi:hypothetical protein